MSPSTDRGCAKSIAVVGGGVAGLTVAALLAARGERVTLFEALDQVGGVARGTDSLGTRFSPGPQYAWGWGPGGPAWRAVEGIDLDVVMRELPAAFEQVSFGDSPFETVTRSLPAALDALPDEEREPALAFAAALDAAGAAGASLGSGARFRDGGYAMLEAILRADLTAHQRRWAFAMRSASVATIAARMGVSERALRMLTHAQGIFAEELDQLSALLFASARHHLNQSLFVPEGGFAALVDGLEDAARRAGVSIRVGARVDDAARTSSGSTLTVGGRRFRCDHIVWACSPGALAGMMKRSDRVASRRLGRKLARGFSRSNPVRSLNALVALSRDDEARLRARNFTWFSDTRDVRFSAPELPGARTINFCSPTLNADLDLDRHVLCAFSHAGEEDLSGLLARELARLGVRPQWLDVREMTPKVWSSRFGGHEGSVYGRRLTAASLKTSTAAMTPRGWHLAHSGAGISGLLGCVQSARAVADAITPSLRRTR